MPAEETGVVPAEEAHAGAPPSRPAIEGLFAYAF